MKRVLLSACLAATAALGQYKLEKAGAPPAELGSAIREALASDGARVVAPDGKPFCEIWLRAKAPTGPKITEENVSFTNLTPGALLGVLRYPGQGADRRGQVIKPGLYTLRFALYPVDGAHQGVSPQRDFVLLTPAAKDTDLNATPGYDELVKMSNQASGTAHPAILSLWKPEAASGGALKQEGEDWVLYSTLGDLPIAILVVGAYQG